MRTIAVPAAIARPERTMNFAHLLVAALRAACRNRADLVLENMALRQQLAVLLGTGRRPRLSAVDRWFWTILRRVWVAVGRGPRIRETGDGSSAGTERASGSTGTGCRAVGVVVGPRSRPKCAPWSGGWPPRTRRGARRAFT